MSVGSANVKEPARYDLVVGADGIMSRTRWLVSDRGPIDDEYARRLGRYTVLFTMQRVPQDAIFAKWYNGARGRPLLLRPDS